MEVKSIEEAKAEGAMALFGEKYGETVRIIKIGNYSMELCGGTHIDNTAKIGSFHILSQEAIGSGVRRIEAVTGHYAFRYARHVAHIVMNIAHELNSGLDELDERVRGLLEQEKALRKEIVELRSAQIKSTLQSIEPVLFEGIRFAAVNAGAVTGKELAAAADMLKHKLGDEGVGVLAGSDGDKVALVVTVGKALAPARLKAGDIVKELAPIVGGGGGGRPDMAQAGGKDPHKLADMLAAVPETIKKLLK